MKNKLEYRIENGSLIIDNYFNDLKIGSINGGSVENILKKCKLYDEEYETFLKENEYMKHIAKDFERLQQENKQLQEKIFQLENLVDVILSSYIFENMCPLELFLEKNLKEKKARCIFYLKNDCEKNCDDDFKKCWLKYFKNLQELENETANNCNDCKKCKGIDSNE